MEKYEIKVRLPGAEPESTYIEVENDATYDDIADKAMDAIFDILDIPTEELDGVAIDIIWDLLEDKVKMTYDIIKKEEVNNYA